MDTYRFSFRFHDENVAWMSEYFVGENTETGGDASRPFKWVTL